MTIPFCKHEITRAHLAWLMRLLGHRIDAKGTSRSNIDRFEPVVGSRKISWDRSRSSTRQFSNAEIDNRSAPADRSFSRELTTRDTNGHSRAVSTGVPSISSGRRRSCQTDTTARTIDPEARLIRIRKSDVFQSKPNLKFRYEDEYSGVDGMLPTLKAGPQRTPFVDNLADDLDTRQLRTVLDTDSRRRKRRQSAMQERLQGKCVTGPAPRSCNGTRALPAVSTTTSFSPTGLSDQNVSDEWPTDIEFTGTTPVYDRFMHTRSRSEASPLTVALIPNGSSHWYDADAMIDKEPSVIEPGIVLAGNRESFPDFAIVDRANPMRQSPGSGRFSTALSTLWRRAGSARSRKHTDVADDREKAFEPTEEDVQHRPPAPRAGDDIPSVVCQQNAPDRHFSASSSVLYETLDDLVQTDYARAGDHLAKTTGMMPAQDPYDGEIPADAFYDPLVTPRATSRATHSRNFSRPTNEFQTGRYLTDKVTTSIQSQGNEFTHIEAFSPLLSGDVFPIPAQRSDDIALGRTAYKYNDEDETQASKAPVDNSPLHREHDLAGFTSCSGAAGLVQSRKRQSMSQAVAGSPSSTEAKYIPARPLPHNESTDNDIGLSSSQPATTNGSAKGSIYTPSNGQVRRILLQPINTGNPQRNDAQTLDATVSSRPFLSQRSSETESDLDSEMQEYSAGSSAASQLTPSERPIDDLDFEQSIWRTGLGRPVQVVDLPNGTVTMDWDGIDVQQHTVPLMTSDVIDALEAPRLLERDSFLSSVYTFHTAEVYTGTINSANSSRSTLRSPQSL